MAAAKPLSPKSRFGRLIAVRRAGQAHKQAMWLCLCDCGNTVTVAAALLRNGQTRSCGCLRREVTIARSRSHGLRHSPEYRIWFSMHQRCRNVRVRNHANYGGRGITVCPQWDDFATFYQDMGPRPSAQHSIERIDNNGPYAAENCRWATRVEQGRNKRNNRLITLAGMTRPLSAWAEDAGLRYGLVMQRIRKGWNPKRALTTQPITSQRDYEYKHPRFKNRQRESVPGEM